MDKAKQEIVDGLLHATLEGMKTQAVVIERAQIGQLTEDEKKSIGDYLSAKVTAAGFGDDPLIGYGSTGWLSLGLKKY